MHENRTYEEWASKIPMYLDSTKKRMVWDALNGTTFGDICLSMMVQQPYHTWVSVAESYYQQALVRLDEAAGRYERMPNSPLAVANKEKIKAMLEERLEFAFMYAEQWERGVTILKQVTA